LEDAPDARFNLAAFLPVDLENDLIIQDQKQAFKPDSRDFKNEIARFIGQIIFKFSIPTHTKAHLHSTMKSQKVNVLRLPIIKINQLYANIGQSHPVNANTVMRFPYQHTLEPPKPKVM